MRLLRLGRKFSCLFFDILLKMSDFIHSGNLSCPLALGCSVTLF